MNAKSQSSSQQTPEASSPVPARSRFINRELSWLEFNGRVLEEARDPENALLERLKFLAISGSNLDEFFMVRVGGLQLLAKQGISQADPAGLSPTHQLHHIGERVSAMVQHQYECLQEELIPLLAEGGIESVQPSDLALDAYTDLADYYNEEIFPLLTPISVSEERQKPFIQGLTIHLAVHLAPAPDDPDKPRFAILALPRNLPRFIPVSQTSGETFRFVFLEDLIQHHLQGLFPGEEIVAASPFRVTRNADLSVREDMAGDLLEQMQEVLQARKHSDSVRLEVHENASPTLYAFLRERFVISEENVYALSGALDLSAFWEVVNVSGFDHLKPTPWKPASSSEIDPHEPVFNSIAMQDVLLYHPYERFDPVVRFLEEAANDPQVLAIKQTLYRVSDNSPIVEALLKAAQQGKHVTVVLELKARFDEERNIEWAQRLEQEGIQVIYGVRRLKTHAKAVIIIRREPEGIRRYLHFGTGNYNERTAHFYTDVGLFTCNEDLAADTSQFFNAITGYSQPLQYRLLEAAPLGLRKRLLELIEQETERARQGYHCRIRAKLNSLADTELTEALYEASQAGVQIELNIRGICILRPGIPQLSENITVISIIDRLLEHARIFYFYHGGEELTFITSADWMSRNLDRRLELMVPILDRHTKRRLHHILDTCLGDTAKARKLRADGTYERVQPPQGEAAFRSQSYLFEEAQERATMGNDASLRVFQPHHPQ